MGSEMCIRDSSGAHRATARRVRRGAPSYRERHEQRRSVTFANAAALPRVLHQKQRALGDIGCAHGLTLDRSGSNSRALFDQLSLRMTSMCAMRSPSSPSGKLSYFLLFRSPC